MEKSDGRRYTWVEATVGAPDPCPSAPHCPSRHTELLEATNLTLNPLLSSQLAQAALIVPSCLFSQHFDLITEQHSSPWGMFAESILNLHLCMSQGPDGNWPTGRLASSVCWLELNWCETHINEITIKLRFGGKASYFYFNEIDNSWDETIGKQESRK